MLPPHPVSRTSWVNSALQAPPPSLQGTVSPSGSLPVQLWTPPLGRQEDLKLSPTGPFLWFLSAFSQETLLGIFQE